MMATNHDGQLGEIYRTMSHEALVFYVFVAVAVMVMVCGRRGLWPSWYRLSRPAGSHKTVRYEPRWL